MTADVPGGQARKAGLGIVMAAKQSGRAILPVAIATKRYLALNTWSRMKINLPHSSLGFAIGPIVRVPREATPEELEKYRQEVEDSLNLATQQAYDRAGGDLSRAVPGGAGAKSTEPGLWLKTYRAVTSFARPMAPLLLGLRERRGKEEPLRRNERLGQPRIKRPAGRLAWFHAASVGETNAILPLMAALAQERPSLSFLLTTGTVTSAKLAAQRLGPRAIHQYAPLDAPEYVASFLDHWRPDLAVFTESEIWPNLILESSARGIPLALVNGRMTKRSFRRWRRNPGFAHPLFSRFDLVLAQNEGLARRFATLGAPNAIPAGNLKIDAPAPLVDDAELERLRPALQGRPLLIAACTHEGEDADRRRCPPPARVELSRLVHHHRAAPSAARRRHRRDAEGPRLQGGAAVAGPAARPQQRCLRRRHHRRARHALQAGAGGLHRRLAGRPRRPQPGRGDAARRRGAGGAALAELRRRLRRAHRATAAPSWCGPPRRSPTPRASSCRDEAELDSMRSRADAALATISGALPRTIEALLQYLPGEEGLARAS